MNRIILAETYDGPEIHQQVKWDPDDAVGLLFLFSKKKKVLFQLAERKRNIPTAVELLIVGARFMRSCCSAEAD
jgi:hypothetical protein